MVNIVALELIHYDLWGPSPVSAVNGQRYYISFVNHYSKYIWLYPLINKSDIFSIFLEFKIHVENFLRRSIKALQTDGGDEFIKFKSYLSSQGIAHCISCPHSNAQTALQKESTATLSRPVSLFWPGQMFHSITGLMLSKLPHFSLIEWPPPSSISYLPTRNYFIKHMTIFPYEFLIVLATLICVHTKPISLVFNLVNMPI